MSTKTLPVTAASFEKVFAALATKQTLGADRDPRRLQKI